MLASEYGWSKREILEEIYLDDVFELQGRIKRRQLLARKMELAIVQNPHIQEDDERRALWDNINEQLEEEGIVETEELDVAAFQTLKSRLSRGSSILIK